MSHVPCPHCGNGFLVVDSICDPQTTGSFLHQLRYINCARRFDPVTQANQAPNIHQILKPYRKKKWWRPARVPGA